MSVYYFSHFEETGVKSEVTCLRQHSLPAQVCLTLAHIHNHCTFLHLVHTPHFIDVETRTQRGELSNITMLIVEE